MEKAVEVADIDITRLISRIVDSSYEEALAGFPEDIHEKTKKSYKRRLAKVCEHIVSNLKKNIRQAPFNPSQLVQQLSVPKPKLVIEEAETDTKLKEKTQILTDELQSKSIAILAKWREISSKIISRLEDVKELKDDSTPIRNSPKLISVWDAFLESQNYKKFKLAELIRDLKELASQKLESPQPLSRTEMVFLESYTSRIV